MLVLRAKTSVPRTHDFDNYLWKGPLIAGDLYTLGGHRYPTLAALLASRESKRMWVVSGVQGNSVYTPINATLFEEVPLEEYIVESLRANDVSLSSNWRAFPVELGGLSVMSGTDPEIFATNPATGEVVPAFSYLKAKPKRKAHLSPFWDGFQAEFTVPAAGCLESLTAYVREGLAHTNIALDEVRKKDGMEGVSLDSTDVVLVSQEMLDDTPSVNKALGCAPSLNAYDMGPSLTGNSDTLQVRSAGCHLHFGVQRHDDRDNVREGLSDDEARAVVKILDMVSGVYQTAVFGDVENTARRQYYGVAGEYRKPKYGVEYRVPSSRILQHPALFILTCDITRVALKVELGLPGMLRKLWKGSEGEIVSIINNSDVEGARQMIRDNIALYRALFRKVYRPEVAANALALATVGARKAGYYKKSVAANWRLTQAFAYDSGWSEVYRWSSQPLIRVPAGASA